MTEKQLELFENLIMGIMCLSAFMTLIIIVSKII
jgi:hypothetical protein